MHVEGGDGLRLLVGVTRRSHGHREREKKKGVRDLRCWNLEYTLLWVCESVRSEGRDFGFGGCGKPQEDDFQREEEEAVVTLGDQNVQLCTQILTFSFFFSRFSRKEM